MSPTRVEHSIEQRSFSIHRRVGDAGRTSVGFTHENPGYEVSWIGSGELEFALGAARRRVVGASAGASILVPPALLNTPRARSTFIQQVLVAEDLVVQAADAFGGSGVVPKGALVHGVDSAVSAIGKAIASEVSSARADDPGLEALVDALVLALVRKRDDRRSDRERIVEPAIRHALAYIDAHYAADVGVDDLARAAGLPRFVFLRKFKAQVGESPYRHLTAVRLDRAAERLRSTRDSVLAVAIDCGFGDPSRFARAFARRFGATPLRWRAHST